MGSKRIISALEFGETNLKLAIAEKDNNDIYVYQSFVVPCSGFKNGQIVDEEELLKCLNKVIKDVKNKLDLSLTSVVLAIPSDELKMFKLTETCRTSNEYTVTDLDVEGLRSQCKRKNPGQGLSIIEVIPTQFYIKEPPRYDDETKYDEAPIGKKSDTLRMDSNILAIPTESLSSYRSLLAKANLELKGYYLQDIASFESYKEQLRFDNTVQINIGSTSTICSVFAKNKLEGTVKIESGSNDIGIDIAEAFKIDSQTANLLKIKFGNAVADLADDTVIYAKGNKLITNKQLSKVVEKRMDMILEKIKEEIAPFIKYGGYQVAIIGMGSYFFNVKEKVANSFKADALQPTPSAFGIRSASFSALYGLLKLSNDDNFQIDAYTTKTNTFQNVNRSVDVSVRLDDINSSAYFNKYDKDDFE